ncbi:MAG TPA: 6-carboxytetrahydropterin synthase [Verrucomicrobiales bacterium]|nr:6-carboxytetrahydropterin synthase [Verrucomicrobiales bacterium]
MPYRICKTFEIENGHMLSKHPDLCKFPHGHTRKIEFVLEVESLDENQMVCDFKLVKKTMKNFLSSWDHALCMNTDDPAFADFQKRYGVRVIGFKSKDPTTEVMAKVIYDTFVKELADYKPDSNTPYLLRQTVKVVKVRVWETSSSWAEYSD